MRHPCHFSSRTADAVVGRRLRERSKWGGEEGGAVEQSGERVERTNVGRVEWVGKGEKRGDWVSKRVNAFGDPHLSCRVSWTEHRADDVSLIKVR